ncbi:hypothetical protein [Methylobacterium durans]|uniref:hypothetical protein n=1 Tax=Methylobacterium durans TaxID=2202825 RepID=UPI0013A5B4D6|nr:hypothetical protein [Methylobacterium durans]
MGLSASAQPEKPIAVPPVQGVVPHDLQPPKPDPATEAKAKADAKTEARARAVEAERRFNERIKANDVKPIDITKAEIAKAKDEAAAKKKAKAEAERKAQEEAAARARIAETEKKAAERDRAWDAQMRRGMGGICKGC